MEQFVYFVFFAASQKGNLARALVFPAAILFQKPEGNLLRTPDGFVK